MNQTETGEIVENNNQADNTDLAVHNPHHIKLKIQYNAFLKALKRQDFTTAYMMAKALNVSQQTISLWLRTPKAIKIMQQDINYYIQKIRAAKDWKAQAYLLDKITSGNDDNKPSSMIGLNIIVQSSK